MTEQSIKLGTALLTPAQLAPRLGYSGKYGARRVITLARAGKLPCWRPNAGTYRFSWPKVEAVLMGKGRE